MTEEGYSMDSCAHTHMNSLTVQFLKMSELSAWIVQREDLNLDLPGDYLGKQFPRCKPEHTGAHKGKGKDDDWGSPLWEELRRH